MLLAELDAFAQCGADFVFQAQVGGEHVGHRGTDVEVIGTHAWRAFEHQDPAHQRIGVLGLFFHLVVDTLVELGKTPILVHPRMDEILITGCQFACQQRVEVIDYVWVTLHRPTSPQALKGCSLNQAERKVTVSTLQKRRKSEKTRLNNAKTAQMRAVLLLV